MNSNYSSSKDYLVDKLLSESLKFEDVPNFTATHEL